MPVFSKRSDREYEALEKKLKVTEDKLMSLEEDLSGQKAAFKQLLDQRPAAEKAQAEQKEENDLLLAQLHQVQEELEKYFLENKTQQEASATLNDALVKANDAAAKANAELKKAQDQLAANTKQAEEAKAKLADTEKKLTEANKLLKSEGDAQIIEIQKQKADLERKAAAANDAATKAKADLEKQMAATNDAATKAKADLEALQASETDLKSENDLLLAQLHQVQEELEKYYLGNKDLESAVTQAAELIRRTRYAIVTHHAEVAGASVRTAPARPTKASKAAKASKRP